VDAILKKKDPSALAASLCAFECLLELCAEHGIAPGAISIAKTELGRPYFSSHPNVDFNVSHTDRYVAVALATDAGERVGIDVEDALRLCKKDGADIEKIAERFLCTNELAEFKKIGSSADKFIELWTRKEAYLKYTGEGIAKMTSTDTLSALPCDVAFL
jgi:4'-phosphopantetheinyl transferase